MLTEQPAFAGDHDAAVIHAILNDDPMRVRGLRSEIPVELERVVSRALSKQRETRYQSTQALAADLEEYRSSGVAPRPVRKGLAAVLMKRAVVLPLAVAIIVVGGLAVWSLDHAATLRRVREERLPELRRLVEQDDYTSALALFREIESVAPDDPALRDLLPRIAVRRSIDTDPPAAAVSIRG
jgi:hypothetical protein